MCAHLFAGLLPTAPRSAPTFLGAVSQTAGESIHASRTIGVLQGKNIMRLPTGKDDMPDGPPSMSIRTVAAPEDGHPSPRIRTVADSAEGALEPLSLRRGHESRGSPGQRHRLHLHNEVPPPIASFTHRLQSSAPGFRRLALAAPFWTEGAWEIVMVPPPPAREVREPVHRGMAGVSSGRSRSGWIP